MENEMFKNIPLFSELSREELKELSNSSVKRRYPNGNIVIHKGDLAQSMFLILRGRVKVILNGRIGSEVILTMLEPGSYFGELSVFDAMPQSATIVTVEESDFLCIPQELIANLIKRKPDVALKMLSELSKRLRETHEQVCNIALLNVRDRIKRLLLRISEEKAIIDDENLRTISRPKSMDIAHMVGTSRETVSRILSEFARRGLISLTKEKITIHEKLKISDNIC